LFFVCFSGTGAGRYAVPTSSSAAAACNPLGPTAATTAIVWTASVWCQPGQEGRQPVAGQGPAAAVHQTRQAPEEDRDQRQEQSARQQ